MSRVVGPTQNSNPGKPVQIVSIGDGKLCVKHDNLKEVVNNWKNANVTEMSVVSVAGPLRTGKSFILSLFLLFLEQSEKLGAVEAVQDDWLENSEIDLMADRLFVSRRQKERVTEGVWVFSRPFIVTIGGKKRGIIVMDTQGLFDNQTSNAGNNAVFGLSLLLSSVQILNLRGGIQEDVLDRLHLFIEHCYTAIKSFAKGSSSETRFSKLEFLIRDYQFFTDEEDLAQCERDGAEYLSQWLADTGHSDRESRRRIRESFQRIDCSVICHPGKKVAKKDKFEATDIDEDFVAMTTSYIRRLFLTSPIKQSLAPGFSMTPDNFQEFITATVEIFSSGLPKQESMVISLTQLVCAQALEASALSYQQETQLQYSSVAEVDQKHTQAKQNAMNNFDKSVEFGDKRVKQEFSKKLSSFLEEKRKETKKMVESQLAASRMNEMVAKTSEDLKRKEQEIRKLQQQQQAQVENMNRLRREQEAAKQEAERKAREQQQKMQQLVREQQMKQAEADRKAREQEQRLRQMAEQQEAERLRAKREADKQAAELRRVQQQREQSRRDQENQKRELEAARKRAEELSRQRSQPPPRPSGGCVIL